MAAASVGSGAPVGRAPPPPLTAEDFFGRSWSGHGVVRDLFGRTLRRVTLRFDGVWSERDSAFLVEESMQYEGAQGMTRSWHIAMDGEGYLLGLEGFQGGRLRACNRPHGFRLDYDRLRQVRAPNVTTASLKMMRDADGIVSARGSTSLLRVLPVVNIRATLREAPPPPTRR